MAGTRIAVHDEQGVLRKITRIDPYRGNGFAVQVPYHSARCGYLPKQPMFYGATDGRLRPSDCIEYSASDRVKLSFHLDGFVQFSAASGSRIVSGIDPATGELRGIGLLGDCPIEVTTGPAFSIVLWGISAFDEADTGTAAEVFLPDDIYPCRRHGHAREGLIIEGFLVPRQYETGISRGQRGRTILFELPFDSPVIFSHELRVIDLPDQPYFLGLIASKTTAGYPSDSGFALSGPSYCPPVGEPLGITAIYPALNWERPTRDLTYRPSEKDA